MGNLLYDLQETSSLTQKLYSEQVQLTNKRQFDLHRLAAKDNTFVVVRMAIISCLILKYPK